MPPLIYYMYLVDAPRKIKRNTFFNLSFDFSIAFAILKIALTFFVMFIIMLSYSQACEPHVVVFNKLLQALTMSKFVGRVLKL